MGMRTTFMVQTFEIHRKRLRPGNRDVAPTESGALKRAEAIAKRMPGTAARRVHRSARQSRTGAASPDASREAYRRLLGQPRHLFRGETSREPVRDTDLGPGKRIGHQ